MTDPNKHPRNETQTERNESHRQLRKHIARKLRDHGQADMVTYPLAERTLPGFEPDREPISGDGCHLLDPKTGDTFQVTRRIHNGRTTLTIMTASWIGDDLRQEFIHSYDKGPFRSQRTSFPIPNEGGREAETAARSINALLGNLGSIATGINNQPITAEEANDLTVKVERSLPYNPLTGETT